MALAMDVLNGGLVSRAVMDVVGLVGAVAIRHWVIEMLCSEVPRVWHTFVAINDSTGAPRSSMHETSHIMHIVRG